MTIGASLGFCGMATDKPRITITLEPKQHDVLKRLAKLEKTSMSRIITQLLSESTPVLEKVVESLEIARKLSADARLNFFKSAQDAEMKIRPIADFAKSQVDFFASEIEKISQSDKERK
jgi:methionyl-tRNA formyltransferase